MTNKPFDLTEPLTAEIRRLLICDWDPCRINLNIEGEDEYDSYIPAIHKLAKIAKSADEIAAQLNHIENSYMGGIVNKAVNCAVAEKIFALVDANRRGE
jgi:hypothetical protein